MNELEVIIWWGFGISGVAFCVWHDLYYLGNDITVKDVFGYSVLSIFGPVFCVFLLWHLLESIDWNWQPLKDFMNKTLIKSKKRIQSNED